MIQNILTALWILYLGGVFYHTLRYMRVTHNARIVCGMYLTFTDYLMCNAMALLWPVFVIIEIIRQVKEG